MGEHVDADWLRWMRRGACEAAGCEDPGYADRGRHAPNCMQAEVDLLLDEVEDLRGRIELVRNLPCCAGCGRLNTAAPREVVDPLREQGESGCVPSQCPAWREVARFDHDTREWVPTEDAGRVP